MVVGLVIAAVAAVAFIIGPAAAMVLVTVVVFLVGAEYFAGCSVVRCPATLLGLVAVGILPLAAYWRRGEAAVPLVLFLSARRRCVWFILGVGGRARPTPTSG